MIGILKGLSQIFGIIKRCSYGLRRNLPAFIDFNLEVRTQLGLRRRNIGQSDHLFEFGRAHHRCHPSDDNVVVNDKMRFFGQRII